MAKSKRKPHTQQPKQQVLPPLDRVLTDREREELTRLGYTPEAGLENALTAEADGCTPPEEVQMIRTRKAA